MIKLMSCIVSVASRLACFDEEQAGGGGEMGSDKRLTSSCGV